jgi:hypothetical protein
MSDDPLKKRIFRAKRAAMEKLRRDGYEVFPSNDKPVCIIGHKTTETRFIRIVLDEIQQADIKAMKKIAERPGICSREIWRRRGLDFKVLVLL